MDMSKRGMVRAVIGQRYKFARYFAPNNFHMPVTFEELIANNDIELYDLHTDPNEMTNLASPANREANRDLIMQLNDKLNSLIVDEFDRDDGREFDNMPQYGGFSAMLTGEY
jgi:arylsulfatase